MLVGGASRHLSWRYDEMSEGKKAFKVERYAEPAKPVSSDIIKTVPPGQDKPSIKINPSVKVKTNEDGTLKSVEVGITGSGTF